MITNGPVSILGPPRGTVPSHVIWDIPNHQTLHTQWSQHTRPTRLDLISHQTLHTPVFQHLVSNMLPSMRCYTSAEITWMHTRNGFGTFGPSSCLGSNTSRATRRYAHPGFNTSDGGLIASEPCLSTQSPTLPGHQTLHTQWFRHI